jgi:hypothetical protein
MVGDELGDKASRVRALAHELAGLGSWETLQCSPDGRVKERRFKVDCTDAAIARALAPYDPLEYLVTGVRFALDEQILIHVVERSPDTAKAESPTRAAKKG